MDPKRLSRSASVSSVCCSSAVDVDTEGMGSSGSYKAAIRSARRLVVFLRRLHI